MKEEMQIKSANGRMKKIEDEKQNIHFMYGFFFRFWNRIHRE